ncbi:response regulator transcription factor [Leucobacter sp. CSA1]|uniref:Response regulator transcription factor n=1 Tax=Leucobacter chromiisoli TaxID=2796471 RepID=A0A934USW3_9MICO|nr:response regulator transcription factor [Leucobacter chromiisoli]MBK0417724.1 response regulator transcription factor [Leucobacter chromiisoli]
MTRVVVVDDQALVRQGIRTLLELAGLEVVGEAGDGEEALAVVAETRPEVLLLDLRMPHRDGLWTLRRLRDDGSDLPALVLTTFDDDALVLQALHAGARGYLLKDVTLEQLTRAVSVLAGGGTFIAPSITDRLLRAIRSGPSPVDTGSPVEELTGRELEVLRLMAEGYSNREIAAAVFLAEGTVKNHVSTILQKLGTRDRTRAVLRALHEGILR